MGAFDSMKKSLLLSLFLVYAAFSFSQGSLADARVSAKKLNKLVKNGKAYLVDVRTLEEFSQSHLASAINIDYKSADFKTQISKLDRKKTVYLYCRTGNRSDKSLDSLKKWNFTHAYNIGGIHTLTTTGLRLE